MDQPDSPRARLQMLLAVPEKQRTEAQWDEINELEITLAPANRGNAAGQNVPRSANKAVGHEMPRGTHSRKSGKKFRRKPPKRSGR